MRASCRSTPAKALKLPGVKAVVTAADFPDIPSEEAFVGEGPMNFRDLSRNCMARDKALYEGHAVAAVAATSQAIADEALELIDVEYEVLPYVIDVEEAMADDAPVLHDDLFTANVEPKPTKPSNIAKRSYFNKGDVEAGFKRGRGHRRRPLHHRAGAPGLYRAACLLVAPTAPTARCTIYSSSQGHFMVRAYVRQAARHRHRQYPRHAGRDRRRVRRQDAGLSGAGGARAVEEVRPAGEDADDAARKCSAPPARPPAPSWTSRSAPRRTAPSSRRSTC